MKIMRYGLVACLLCLTSLAGAVEYYPYSSNDIGLEAFAIIKRFVGDSQDRMKELDRLMTTPCVSAGVEATQALFKTVQQQWDETVTAQQDAFGSEIKAAEGEYGKYRANKGRTTGKAIEHRIRKRFPNEDIYDKWLEPSKEQWDWIFADGAPFFKLMKRFEAQTFLNGIGADNAKDSYEYLEGLCDELHEALVAAQADPTAENIQACKNLATYPTMVTKIWVETCNELDKFSLERKPENYTDDMNRIYHWFPGQKSFSATYKTKWTDRIKDQYDKYKKSFKAVNIAWTVCRAGAYMYKDKPLFKGWAVSDFQTKFDAFVAALEGN